MKPSIVVRPAKAKKWIAGPCFRNDGVVVCLGPDKDVSYTYQEYKRHLEKQPQTSRPVSMTLDFFGEISDSQHALECISLCQTTLEHLLVQSTSSRVLELILRRACHASPYTVKRMELQATYVSYTTFTSLLASGDCVIEDLTLNFVLLQWNASNFYSGNFIRDYGKLKRLTLIPNDAQTRATIFKALKDTPSKLDHLNLLRNGESSAEQHGALSLSDLPDFTAMISAQQQLKSLRFTISEKAFDEDRANSYSKILNFLESILVSPETQLEHLDLYAANVRKTGQLGGLLINSIGNENWYNSYLPILRKNSTLLSLKHEDEVGRYIMFCQSDSVHSGTMCAEDRAILRRNQILRKMKMNGPWQRDHPNRSRNVSSIFRKTRSGHVPPSTLARTLAKLASAKVENSALYYFLQRNVTRVVRTKAAAGLNTSMKRSAGTGTVPRKTKSTKFGG